MKKYWKLITVVGITMVCLGVFYIKSSHISKTYPDFKINSIHGDNKVLNNVVFNGEIHQDEYWYTVEGFQLTKDATNYLMDEPYLMRLNYTYPLYQMERLKKEYRQFMRGKPEIPSLFYEDDKVLAYVNTNTESVWHYYNNLFEIDVLNKETKERISVVKEIPDRSEYDYLDIEAIRVIGEEVYIITTSTNYNENDTVTTINQYTFNLIDEKVVDKEIDKIVLPDGDYNSYVEIIPSVSNPQELVFSSFIIEFISPTNEDDEYREEITLQGLKYYNLGQEESKDVPAQKEQELLPIAYYENYLYLSDTKAGRMTIYKHNIDTNEIEGEVDIPIVADYDKFITDGALGPISDEGIFYLTSHFTGSGTPVYAIDLVAMDIVFEGEIDIKNTPGNEDQLWIDFANIEIRQ